MTNFGEMTNFLNDIQSKLTCLGDGNVNSNQVKEIQDKLDNLEKKFKFYEE